MCAAAINCEKITKTPILGIQGRLRSSMLTNLKSLLPVLVMISSMSVPICNRFYTRQVNSGKITSFKEGRPTPIWLPRSRGTPSPKGTKFCHEKLESLWQPQWRSRNHIDCQAQGANQPGGERASGRMSQWANRQRGKKARHPNVLFEKQTRGSWKG